ncbi:DNA primase [uncultured archaeon]|nr:DNA primase [uncultured archaeon]
MKLDFKGTLSVVKSKVTFNQVLESYGFKTGPGLIVCPLHSESTGSFKIYDGDTGEGNFWCFGCQKGGDMLTFVELYEGIGKGQALNRLATKFNIDVKTREYSNHIVNSLDAILKPKEPKTPEVCLELKVALECSREFSNLSEQALTPYMVNKSVNHFGTRSKGNLLVVPVMDIEDNLWNLQYIYPDGRKLFKKDGRRKGCLFRIGAEDNIGPDFRVFLAEGYSTGASVYMATGCTTFISFTSCNLGLVYNALKEKYPGVCLSLAGDNDVSGRMHSLPAFYPKKEGQDWNDVWVEGGAQAVLNGLNPDNLVVGNPLNERVNQNLNYHGRL